MIWSIRNIKQFDWNFLILNYNNKHNKRQYIIHQYLKMHTMVWAPVYGFHLPRHQSKMQTHVININNRHISSGVWPSFLTFYYTCIQIRAHNIFVCMCIFFSPLSAFQNHYIFNKKDNFPFLSSAVLAKAFVLSI